MSFFGKFKTGSSAPSEQSKTASPAKKDPHAPVPTPLEKHLADASALPVRLDGSDKFFGFENYGSTCYANSIIQCLYYSAPFREHVLNFPSKDFLDGLGSQLTIDTSVDTKTLNGAPLSPNGSSTPYPNPTSPARKPIAPTSPGPGTTRPEDNKDSPEYKKKLAISAGPVLDMTGTQAKKYGMDESLFTSLKDIFEAVISNQSRIGVVSPHKFLEILRRENEMFRSAMHQDAHEFLNLLLNQVVENVEEFAKRNPDPAQTVQTNGAPPEEKGLALSMSSALASAKATTSAHDTHWVHDLFEGLLTSETRCLTCENTSQRDEAFLDLSVDLEAHTSVTSCLRKFSEEEMLCERNKFHCDNCGGLQEAEKRMIIKRLPRVLALHLKRFKYTEDLQRLQKLFHRVVYPFHLRLFNTTDDAEDPDRLYELYSVVVHIGGGPYHGHYVSIVKTQDRGWLLFDDELVEPVSKDYVLSFFGGEPVPGAQDARQLACAYVLFYQETTMEAVLKEQELENLQAEGRVSDVGSPSIDVQSPTTRNGLHHMNTFTGPIPEEMDHMESLAHARTAPQLPSISTAAVAAATAAATTVSPPPAGANSPPHATEHHHSQSTPLTSTTATSVPPPALGPPKSKKELKAEEKDRKAREKLEAKERETQLKAEERERALKRKEQSAKRIEALKKQDEEMKLALEESKRSALEEAKTRGDAASSADDSTYKANKEGGGGGSSLASRFSRHGSMSLRSKPRFLGGGGSTGNGNGGSNPNIEEGSGSSARLPTVPQGNPLPPSSTTMLPNGGASPSTPMMKDQAPQEKEKKSRFSLGRKRSIMMSKD